MLLKIKFYASKLRSSDKPENIKGSRLQLDLYDKINFILDSD